ncbi:MAG: chitobiase/beta-hexosaminidase C-terminal domain-containing protein [Deltaproteobacteria bacterium]|nr:chitobiase/beta-hexosaminidase C-terminal domain-containing protein [Deltaproteobacteria bacterium]
MTRSLIAFALLATLLSGCPEPAPTDTPDLVPPVTVATPAGGAFDAPFSVDLACTDEGGTCAGTWYTLDGSAPTEASEAWGGPLQLTQTTTLRFFSVDAAGNAEHPRSEHYAFDEVPPLDTEAPTLTALPAPGTYATSLLVLLRCDDGAGTGCEAIHYTLDGSAPTLASPLHLEPLLLDADTLVTALAVDRAGNQSAPQTFAYTVDTRAPSTLASPPSGTYATAQTVTLTCDDGAGTGCTATHYTLDGSAPDEGSPLYTAPLTLDASATLRFFSLDAAGNREPERSETYLVDLDPPVTGLQPPAGTYAGTVWLTFTCADAGAGCAATHFTLDGSAPDLGSPIYATAVPLATSATVRFFSVDRAGHAEAPGSADYLVDRDGPATTASIPGGIHAAAVQVALSCDDGAGSGCQAIHLTLDGSTPTLASPVYSAPLDITADTTLRYFGVDAAGNTEPVQTQSYVIDTAAPTSGATPPGGFFRDGPTVALACDDGAGSGCSAIHYTLDGSAPTTASPLYVLPLTLGATTTLRFAAVDRAGNVDAPRQELYTLDRLAPTTTPDVAPGAYDGSQSITLACDDGPGSGCAATHYTLDGSLPTTASPVATAPITLSATGELRFRSVDAVGNLEDPRSAAYLIDLLPPATTATPGSGTYNTTLSVQLACSDGAGSGCVTTYYTVDGGEPSTSSSIYLGPIPLSASTTLKFFSVDAVGRSEATVTRDYLLDLAAPVTTASPGGGTYGSAQSVGLSCDDGGGTGCAATYYTLDGTPPTTSSTLYAGPVAVAADATLRFFSTDLAGNAETPRSEVYRVDQVGPVVIAADPDDGGTRVFVNAILSVTFDEDVQPATVTPSTFLLHDAGGVPVVGSVAYDAPSRTATFTPSAPLAGASVFAITLTTGILDLVGNPMAAPHLIDFETTYPQVQLGDDRSATATTGGLAYDSAGNGMLVWLAYDGVGCHLSYATYDVTTDSWSADATLTSEARCGYDPPIALASNGSTFMVAWKNDYADVLVSEWVAGAWLPETTLEASAYSRYSTAKLDLATDGVGYALAYETRNTFYQIKVALHDGSTWATPVTVQTAVVDALLPSITGGAAGYLAAWSTTDGEVFAAHRPAATGIWASEVRLDTTTAYSGGALAESNGATYLVAWQEGNNLWAALGDGATYPAPLQMNTSGTGAKLLDLASDGTGYLVAFGAYANPVQGAYVRRHDGSAWGAQTLVANRGLPAEGGAAASDGSGYFLAIDFRDSLNKRHELGYTVWNGATWSAEAPLEGEAATARNPVAAAGAGLYGVAWDQLVGTVHQVRFRDFDGSTLSATSERLAAPHPGSAGLARMAADDQGRLLAVWEQVAHGAASVMASYWDGAAWSVPMLVAQDATSPDVTSDGTRFMIAWQGGNDSTYKVGARGFDGVSLGAVVQPGFGNWSTRPRLAGNDTGYLLVWANIDSVWASIYQGGAWLPSTKISQATASVDVHPAASSDGSGYLVAWTQRIGGSYDSILSTLATYDALGGTWSWSAPVLAEEQDVDVQEVLTLGDASGYRLVFTTGSTSGDGGVYLRDWSAGGWQAQQTLHVGFRLICSDLAGRRLGAGDVLVYRCDLEYFGNAEAAGGWSETSLGSGFGGDVVMATEGSTAAVVFTGSRFLVTSETARATRFDGAGWEPVYVTSETGRRALHPALMHDGTHYLGVWQEENPSTGVHRIVMRREP